MENFLNKFELLVSDAPSTWHADVKWREENRGWLKFSQAIAISVIAALREKNISQKMLAEQMGVSPQQINKIVKGKENLTLQTIAKLEQHLGLSLIFMPNQ